MGLTTITELSNKYGSDASFVLAGGGNTSYKDDLHLWVKPSGTSLATIKEEDFLKMERSKLSTLFETEYPSDVTQREEIVKNIMLDAVSEGFSGRPSVEAPLHNIFTAKYVVHTHPAFVNGMTTAVNGEKVCKELFPDAIWIEYIDPGFTLAEVVKSRIDDYLSKNGKQPKVVFLQNHGVFVAANTPEEIDSLYDNIMDTLKKAYRKAGVSTTLSMSGIDNTYVDKIKEVLMSIFNEMAIEVSETFTISNGPLTPDHIVYTKSFAFEGEITKEAFEEFKVKHGYYPVVVSGDKAVFTISDNQKNAKTAMAIAKDAGLIIQLTKAFGGVYFLEDKYRLFIENWEVESYRKKISSK